MVRQWAFWYPLGKIKDKRTVEPGERQCHVGEKSTALETDSMNSTSAMDVI